MKKTMITFISTFILLIAFNAISNGQDAMVFKVVEDMPLFPGCENKNLNKNETKKCAEGEMLKYIYSNIKYPKVAKLNKIEGRVILQFIINVDGSISNTKVLREIGGGCGDEAARVVNSMPKWTPGKQRGQPVRVQYTLPVKFKLDKVKEEKPVVEEPEVCIEKEPEIVKPDNESRIFKVVEELPRFPGCEDQKLSKVKLKQCAEKKMLKYIYSNIEYPNIAKKEGIEGRVILQFVVDKDGSIINTKVLRDIGGGCGDEAARVANSMPKWIPAKQRGKPVKVQYTLPISFKLDKKKLKKSKF